MSETSDEDKAKIVMLSGLNWDNDEIAEEVGVSESTVSKYSNQFEEKSKSADDWMSVYWTIILADVFDTAFIETVANRLT